MLECKQSQIQNPELFALEFGKIAESDFVYTPASKILTSQHQTWSKCI